MAVKIIQHCILLVLLFEVIKSQMQPTITKYLRLTNAGPYSQSPSLASVPTVGYQRANAPTTGISSLSSMNLPSILRSVLPTSMPSISNGAGMPKLASLNSKSLPELPALPSSIESGGLDAAVLNNIAIALQLLILNNIMNKPQDSESELDGSKDFEVFESFLPQEMKQALKNKNNKEIRKTLSYNQPSASFKEDLYSQNYLQPQQMYKTSSQPQNDQPESMLNANFLGSSSFVDPSSMLGSLPSAGSFGFGSSSSNPRSSFTLMSPYEALGPNSPFSDPILSSPYGTVISTKKDFQNPYSAFESNNDLFSMDNLF